MSGRGAAPGGAPRKKKIDNFLSIFGKNFLVLKDRILGNTEFQNTGNYVTRITDKLRPSRREVKIDVS